MSNLARYVLGDTVLVQAWWTRPKGQEVVCRLEAVHGEAATVRPVAGANPHSRFVSASDILGPAMAPTDSVTARGGEHG